MQLSSQEMSSLPHSAPSEERLLAILLRHPTELGPVRQIINTANFFLPKNQLLYETILEVVDSGLPVQSEILYDRFNQKNIFDKVGGPRRITELLHVESHPHEAVTHARIIADRALQREVMILGKGLMDEGANSDPHDMIKESIERLAQLNGKFGSVGDLRIMQASLTASDLVDSDIKRPESIVGDGVMTENSFTLLYGRPGLGKTWLMLQKAISIAGGTPWLGLECKQRRVGVIEMEMHSYYLRERLELLLSLIKDEKKRREVSDNIELICRPNFQGSIDLGTAGARNGITTWIQDRGIGAVFMDALSRLHFAKETDAQDMGRILGNIERIRDETGAALEAVHHEPKAPSDGKEIGDLDAARGSSRLQSDPHTMIRLKQRHGKLVLVFPKMNLGPELEPIWLERSDEGYYHTAQPPGDMAAVAQRNEERVREFMEARDYNCTVEQVSQALSMSTRTVRKHLKAMGFRQKRGGQIVSLFGEKEEAPRSGEGAPVDGVEEEGTEGASDADEDTPLVTDPDLPF